MWGVGCGMWGGEAAAGARVVRTASEAASRARSHSSPRREGRARYPPRMPLFGCVCPHGCSPRGGPWWPRYDFPAEPLATARTHFPCTACAPCGQVCAALETASPCPSEFVADPLSLFALSLPAGWVPVPGCAPDPLVLAPAGWVTAATRCRADTGPAATTVTKPPLKSSARTRATTARLCMRIPFPRSMRCHWFAAD